MRCRSCEPLPEEVRRAADLLERRWTVSVIWASHAGAVRFGEFMQSLGSIPPATLTTRLTELEEAGILVRATVDGRRPRVEHASFEQAGADELVEARRQRRRRHAPERLLELVEPHGALDSRVEDRQRPAAFEEVRRAADLLGYRATPPAAHGPPTAPERARAPHPWSSPGGMSSRRAHPAAHPRDRDGSAPG